MERTETQQAERAPASTTGQAAAANNCSCNCDYGCDCDCDYGCGCCCGCERAPTGLSIYQQARRMLRPDGEQMESLPRHPLESRWRADGEQGPSYRNAAQDQNQRRAPAEREPASIWQAAPAKNIKQEEEQAKKERRKNRQIRNTRIRHDVEALRHELEEPPHPRFTITSSGQVIKFHHTTPRPDRNKDYVTVENIRQEEEQAADSKLVTSFQNLRTKRE